MDFLKKEDKTRRKFIKGVAGATVYCCTCFQLDSLADYFEGKERYFNGKEYLAAACGTYCGACPAYLAKHGEDDQIKMRSQQRLASGKTNTSKGIPDPGWMDGLFCDGCTSGGILAAHCQNCPIRKCAANKQNNSRCSDCDQLPCFRMTNLINMGDYLHRKEYLPNLAKIREMGVQEWVKYEEARWRCPHCSLPMSWYDTECVRCGEPRSKQLFKLT